MAKPASGKIDYYDQEMTGGSEGPADPEKTTCVLSIMRAPTSTDFTHREELAMATQLPSYQAYTVIKREGQDDFWLNVGAAFMHQDGDGFNVVLQALPINGKIVLRLPKTDDKDDPERAKQAIREENDRRKSTRRDK